ncbi:probable glucanotransferase [Fusibacter sp. 3D3]|nr:probable glucanotransferase [Fusibacter sp. 3D3]
MLMILLWMSVVTSGCASENEALITQPFPFNYGVFLSVDNSDLSLFKDYQTIVIDAAYFEKEDIQKLKEAGHTVYTYINIGSIEAFRPYYETFKSLTMGAYENWDEEEWVDVSDESWQTFIIEDLAKGFKAKGIDGYFVDNCDVYYVNHTSEIYEGVERILKALRQTGLEVVINGGDMFVTEYEEANGSIEAIMTGVNQESVFSAINFEQGTFGKQDQENQQYYFEYIELVKNEGFDVYLLEYTKDRKLIQSIEQYCSEKNYIYYISDSIELD